MTGSEVKTIRESIGLTQAAMAELCGCKMRTYQRWEQNGVDSQNERLVRLVAYPEVREIAEKL